MRFFDTDSFCSLVAQPTGGCLLTQVAIGLDIRPFSGECPLRPRSRHDCGSARLISAWLPLHSRRFHARKI
jgi:hypothetical protein